MKVGVGAMNTPSVGIAALNTEPGFNLPPLPISLRPGSVIRVPTIRLTYNGPPNIRLAVGVAWKPAITKFIGFTFTASFDNGDNIAVDENGNMFRGISTPFTIVAGDVGEEKTFALGSTLAPKLTVPEKRTYFTVKGVEEARFIDKVDVWIWMVNVTEIETTIGRALTPLDLQRNRILSDERFFLFTDTDADVLDII